MHQKQVSGLFNATAQLRPVVLWTHFRCTTRDKKQAYALNCSELALLVSLSCPHLVLSSKMNRYQLAQLSVLLYLWTVVKKLCLHTPVLRAQVEAHLMFCLQHVLQELKFVGRSCLPQIGLLTREISLPKNGRAVVWLFFFFFF